MKVTRLLWKKEIGECASTRLENERERIELKGVAVEGEVAGVVGAVVEEVLKVIVADALGTPAGVAGAEYVLNTPINDTTDKVFRSAPNPHHDPGPGHLEGGALLLVIPLSARGVLGPDLSALPEGIVPRDDTQGHTRGLALPHLVDGNVPSPRHLPVNGSPVLVARSVIAAVPLPAEDATHPMTAPGHVAEALDTGQVGVVGVLPLHDAESRAPQDLLPRKVGGAKEVQTVVAVTLVVNLPVAQTTWMPVAAA